MDYKTWVLTWDFSSDNRSRTVPPHPIFAKKENRALWEEHRAVHRERIANLNSEAIQEINNFLRKSSLSEDDCKLLAEHIPCEYMKAIEEDKSRPRPSRMNYELENIRKSAIDLERSLRNISNISIQYLMYSMSDDVSPEEKCRCPDPWEVFFYCSPQEYEVRFGLNPVTLFGLSELARSSAEVLQWIPDDAGSSRSGLYDATGSRVRTRLTQGVRVLLRHLELPCGSHKYGPVSSFVSLVHKAAFSETPSWADRYAAMSTELEKEWSKQEDEDKDSVLLNSLKMDKILEKVEQDKIRRENRIERYLAELKLCDDTPQDQSDLDD